MRERLRIALKAASAHVLISLFIAVLAGLVVFEIWYPEPLQRTFGGRNLFLILIGVDVICGPLLTLILFSPKKSRLELTIDLGMVALMQVAALCVGLWSVYIARPLFLVVEFDRVKVVALPDVEEGGFDRLNPDIGISFWKGPQLVGLRDPHGKDEKEKVMFESVQGGRDYGERPEFYIKYDDAVARKSLIKARDLPDFLEKNPETMPEATRIMEGSRINKENLKYLPLMGREDWVAVLNSSGHIIGYLKGDGFK